MEQWYKEHVLQIEQYLQARCSEKNQPGQKLYDAMGYSLLGGGKRLRPVLALEFCRMVGGDVSKALPFAAAVEMIHTYSLIHDDLPAMDDDALRRGKPTCHVQFDEATAILAGDALQTAAFAEILSADMPADARVFAGRVLAHRAGCRGMVMGQVLDLEGESRALTEAEMIQVHTKKTGALITAACVLGVVAGGGTREQMEAAARFARAFGLAFQIGDDLLDCIGESEIFGKTIGSDKISGKTTFATLFGLEGARGKLAQTIENAKKMLDGAFDEPTKLYALADWLLTRKN